eukprot:GFUD01068769.1.p1 GENE.GFUD01068769.1~~GFUD01068769.1.p1  ORF type:complete len:130 (-),score=19.62 GFUD01068769.1:115-504(-)
MKSSDEKNETKDNEISSVESKFLAPINHHIAVERLQPVLGRVPLSHYQPGLEQPEHHHLLGPNSKQVQLALPLLDHGQPQHYNKPPGHEQPQHHLDSDTQQLQYLLPCVPTGLLRVMIRTLALVGFSQW